MKVKSVCPLGSECEQAIDGEVRRCSWYVRVTCSSPATGATFDEWGCAMAWLPALLVENARTNRGQTAALESFRNESVQGQKTFNLIMQEAVNRFSVKRLIDG